MGSELDRPLGQNRDNDRKPGRHRVPRRAILVALAVAVVAGGSLYAALLPDNVSEGGVTKAGRSAPAGKAMKSGGLLAAGESAAGANASSPDQPQTARTQSGTSGAALSTTMSSSGVTVTTISPSDRDSSGPVVIHAGRQVGQDVHMASQPQPGLFKDTQYGKLPIEGSDGARPMDVYARPAPDSDGVRIAIVVGGLGLSQTGTLNAIKLLPPEVTLAFAATGNSLERWMQAARRGGHEILLQVPMEPFGYPGTNPGPDTLTVADGKKKELDALHSSMGQITNYTGIMNYMGGRLMADADAITPVLREVGRRGLLFLDDGSSRQSLVGKLAGPLGLPYARATMQLDADVDREAIATKLTELEQIAKGQGSAIGVASAFDASIQTIAEWAEKAQSEGIEIVGVSQLVKDPQSDGQGQ